MTLAPTQYINTAHKKGDVLMRDQFFTHGDIPFVHFIHPLSTYCHTHVPTHDVWQVSFNSTHLPPTKRRARHHACGTANGVLT